MAWANARNGWSGSCGASRLELTTAGLRMQVRSSWGDGELSTRLSGRFNASNLLAALATLLALEMPLSEALARLARNGRAPGRMERIGGGPDQPLAVIDYAHTPHALEQALTALRDPARRDGYGACLAVAATAMPASVR
jgi:UDP-N-acetylmuramoyl-L-alanyl-D-glutamate--2,6-diaminopimelate ligase